MAVLRPLGAPPAGGALRLDPLSEGHRAALKAACAEDAAIWEMYAVSYDPDHFDAAFDALIANPDREAFAIVAEGVLVGVTAWIWREVATTVEIGNTYLVPAMRGTGLNGRVKRMLIDHGFARGILRIELRIDDRNARSKAATGKIATFEGLLRAERVTWTGHVRDTAIFSILPGEWR